MLSHKGKFEQERPNLPQRTASWTSRRFMKMIRRELGEHAQKTVRVRPIDFFPCAFYCFFEEQSQPQEAQLPLQPLLPQLQLPLLRMVFRRAKKTITASAASRIQSIRCIGASFQPSPAPSAMPMSRSSSAASQATPHCQSTTPIDQPRPSSRRMEAMAATQGV